MLEIAYQGSTAFPLVPQPGNPVTWFLLIPFLEASELHKPLVVAKVWFSWADGIALGDGTVMGDLSIALAIARIQFWCRDGCRNRPNEIVGAYILQGQAAPWYGCWSDRLFGPIPADW